LEKKTTKIFINKNIKWLNVTLQQWVGLPAEVIKVIPGVLVVYDIIKMIDNQNRFHGKCRLYIVRMCSRVFVFKYMHTHYTYYNIIVLSIVENV